MMSIPKNKLYDILIISNIIWIILLLLFFNNSNIDVTIQNLLFDFNNKEWLIDKNEPIKKIFFYNLPKIILTTLIISLSVILLFFRKKNLIKKYQPQLILFLLGITIIPLIACNIKNFTNIYCPNQLEVYDGNYPYTKILNSYPENFIQDKKGRCFPAAHAVTGFCFMILFFILEKKRNKILSLFIALILGCAVGFYQMAKGTHFLSDTLISMMICFLIATIIAKLFYLKYNFSSKN